MIDQITKNKWELQDDTSAVYKTYDLGVSAALLCEDFELFSVERENPRKAQFVFKREDEIEEIADSYFSNRLEVRARSYFDQLKALKNKLYSD